MLVVGVSMGGAAFLLAKPAIEVEALILESVYSDIETAIANRLGSRLPGGEFLTPLLAAQIKPRTGIAAPGLAVEYCHFSCKYLSHSIQQYCPRGRLFCSAAYFALRMDDCLNTQTIH